MLVNYAEAAHWPIDPARLDLVVRDPGPFQRLAVEKHLADVLVRVRQIVRGDDEMLARRQVDGDAIGERAADDILPAAGRHRIESHRGEQQPCRHLAEVVVAGETVGRGVILAVDDLLQPLLRPPRLAGIFV